MRNVKLEMETQSWHSPVDIVTYLNMKSTLIYADRHLTMVEYILMNSSLYPIGVIV
jgi:hypothetical protein